MFPFLCFGLPLDQVKYHNAWVAAQIQAVYNAYLEVAKASIDRSLQRAEFVQKVAAAIGSLCTTLIALSFAVGEGNTTLPARGFAPAIFLGLSFALSAVYVAFITKPGKSPIPRADGTLYRSQQRRRIGFVLWVREAILQRRWALQSSVVSLGIGILFLPSAYVSLPSGQEESFIWYLALLGVLITFVTSLLAPVFDKEES